MSFSPTAKLAAGICIAYLAMSDPARHALERHMLTHMLVQIPALLAAGVLIGAGTLTSATPARWNVAGIPALLAAWFIVSFWMAPIALDHAVASFRWDAAKAISLVAAGTLAVSGWRSAPIVVQAFFGGNMVWMTIAIGQLYQDNSERLCNAYLMDDQAMTGTALTWLACAFAALWLLAIAIPHRVSHHANPPHTGANAHED